MRDQKPRVLEKHPIGEKTTFRGRRRGRKLRPQLDKLFKESLHTFLVEDATKSEKIDFKTFGVARLRVNNSGVSLQNNVTFNIFKFKKGNT